MHSTNSIYNLRQSFLDYWRSRKEERKISRDPERNFNGNGRDQTSRSSDRDFLSETSMLRTLQSYHIAGNEARVEFMERYEILYYASTFISFKWLTWRRHSSLAPYKMAVSAEQVSIFLTADNTVISFFEASAADIERPIIRRLSTPGTILRESNDGSLLVQAIVDAIVDLSFPVCFPFILWVS